MSEFKKQFNQEYEEGTWAIGKIITWIVGLSIILGSIGYVLGWFSDAAQVAKDEFGPEAAMQKYEWFIDQANRIQKMDQDIINLRAKKENTSTQFETDYGKKKDWDVVTKATYQKEINLATEQLNTTIAQRNGLAADYNAASEKFNWRGFKTDARKPVETFTPLTE
jgi:hypothetical protein